MKQKTQVHAEDNKQELHITREFDLPLELLFKAYTDPAIVEQWMGTRVIKLENHKHGSWQFETSTPQGDVVFKASGVIHDLVLNQKITRTFEMENTPFAPQLEFLEFEALTSHTSKLSIHIIYKSVSLRNQALSLPFAQGLNMAHNKLQSVVNNLT